MTSESAAARIVIDATTSVIVQEIYHWYGIDRISINEIIRRLNSRPDVPLPPKCRTGQWTRLAVRKVLSNTRYRGEWRYGVFENVFLPVEDYVRQYERDTPLKSIQIEELRIVSDQVWYSAQERLLKERNRGGRKAKDGDRHSRPRALNGLFVCPTHNQILYVGGPYGRSMVSAAAKSFPPKAGRSSPT